MGLYERFKKLKKEAAIKLHFDSSNGFNFSNVPDSLANSSFWCCVVSLARQYATLPLHAFEKNSKGQNIQLANDRLLPTLLEYPCPYMSAYQWRFVMGFNFEMYGVAYAIIERSRQGLPKNLYPVSPRSLVGHWKDNRLYYKSLDGCDYPAEDILAIYNTPSGYGSTVLEPVRYAQNDVELEAMCHKMQLEYYSGGSVMGKIIKVPSQMTDEQQDKIKAKFDTQKGYKNIVLDNRVEVVPIQIPTSDISRLTEAQKWSMDEVARRFGVPPFFLGKEGTYNSSEQQGLQMVIYCLRPRITAWESAIKSSVCQNGQFIKFNLEGLLRGDHASRANFYHNAVMDGWMSPNEIRAKEDMLPIKDGDNYFFPMNYGSLGDIASGKYSNNGTVWDLSTEAIDKDKLEEKKAHDRAFLKESGAPAMSAKGKLQRLIRSQIKAEIDEIKNLVATGKPWNSVLEDFVAWLNVHAAELHPQYKALYVDVLRRMLPVVKKEVGSDENIADQKIDSFVGEYSSSLVSRIQGATYKTVVDSAQLGDYTACQEMLDSMPSNQANEEVNRSSNAFNVFLYANLGVQYMHVVASPDACPFCRKIDGKITKVNGYVLSKGSDQDDGEGGIRHINKNYKHPPFHTHCSCGVAPGV